MHMPEELRTRMRAVQAVVFDLDGVFTDGSLYLSEDGQEGRRFNTRDGLGVKRLIDAGIGVAIVSGRRSPIVTRRMRELGVAAVHQGIARKGPVFAELVRDFAVGAEATAAVGDDLPDLEMFAAAGLAIAVADAVQEVRAAAHWVTRAGGGCGAVREISDALLAARA